MKRRELVGLGGAVVLGTAVGGVDSKARDGGKIALPQPPDLSFLREGPLVNVARARQFMANEGVDAVVVTHPGNVFYLTGHWPQLDRMGRDHTAMAILPRDPARPPVLIMQSFLHYYTHSDESPAGERLVFTYTTRAAAEANATAPAGDEPLAVPPSTYRILEESLVTPRERSRRARVAAVRNNAAGPDWALRNALRELKLESATLGIDDQDIAVMLGQVGFTARCVPGENLMRRIRLVKSAREVQLMRIGAQLNVDAAVEAVKLVRAAGNTRVFRAAFFTAAAKRGLTPVYMVINGSSSEVMNADISEGQAFAIDCVSSLRFYHADFARTVLVGDPGTRMKTIVAATHQAWKDVRSSLRPGLRFAEVQKVGRDSLRRQGMDINISFTPHSVGLFHTDHPYPTVQDPRAVEALRLEEGMVLSVDCPLGDTGAGGTSHLEDLSLITREGSEPIHSVPPNVFVV